MNWTDDLKACAALVERGDADRFMAVMAAPAEARPPLFALYAFNVEVSRAPWVTEEPMIAEMRLQWWRDVLEQIEQGQPVRRHEVATPLTDVLTADTVPLLDQLVQARRWDAYKDPFEDEAHFTEYLERTSGHLLYAAGLALGKADLEVCLDAGFASGLARFLQAVPALEKAKRIPLVDGRSAAVSALAAQGLKRLERARHGRGRVHGNAMLATWETGALLKQAMRAPERVAQGALGQSDFAKRAGLMWASATGRW